MKETLFNNRLLAFFIFFSALIPASKAQVLDWQYKDLFTDIQQSGARPDLHVAVNGDIYVSYWNPSADQLYFARRTKTTGQWVVESVDQSRPGGYASAITVDASGHVHIAYLENSVSIAYLRYATNASGAWVTQNVLPGRSLGPYGFENFYPVYRQPSVDITLNAGGQPVIAFFDGDIRSYSTCTSPPYNMPSNYDLNLNVVVRQAGGAWNTPVALNAPFLKAGCLDGGDRHGEFCRFIPGVGDSLRLITNSYHNHQVVMFSASETNLADWTLRAIDSTQRFFPVSNTGGGHQWYEGFEYIDGLAAGDTAMHLVYGLSELFGNGVITNTGRRTFMYAHLRPDSLGMAGYVPRYVDMNPPLVPTNILSRSRDYRAMYSVAAKDNHIFVFSVNITKGLMTLRASHNRGLTWAQDTLRALTTNSPLKSAVYGDTVFVLSYDQAKNHLIYSSRHLLGGAWQHRPATIQENRGASLSAQIVSGGSTDLLRIAYNETFADRLYYSEGTFGGAWATEAVDVSGRNVRHISQATANNGDPCIAYTMSKPEQLRFARKNGGNWTFSTVDNAAQPRDVVMEIHNDSVHICYYDLAIGGLRYARGAVGGGAWVRQVIDTSSQIVGNRPDLEIGPGGELHVSYADAINGKLKYAHRTATGLWTLSDVTETLVYNPAQSSIRLDANGLPRIAFRDAKGNAVVFAERDINGLWTATEVISHATNLMAVPLKLVLDASDRPWIVYNYSSILDELRLLRRDAQSNWNMVSVNNNAAEVANVFDFLLADRDFYIVGKKNAFQNNGIGVLYAANGVATDLTPRLDKATLAMTLFPNPAQDQVTVAFTLPAQAAVRIELYDLMGRRVAIAGENPALPAGEHRQEIETHALPAGLYFCNLTVGREVFTQKVIISH